MSKKVVKIDDFNTNDITLPMPEKTDTKLRFSKAELPLIQTSEMTYSYYDDNLELLCNPHHADTIHQIDESICTTLSNNSEAWFGKHITYDQIERMFRPTLQGGKNPRQILKTFDLNKKQFKTFDTNTKPTDKLPPSGSAIFIIKLDGVKFEEKVCETQWSVVQAKECLPPTTITQPMFVN